MPQTSSRIFDDIAKLMTDAAGAADGVRREVEGVMRAQGERVMGAMDIVQREDFEAVKAMAVRAREDNEKLAARVALLEQQLAQLKQGQT
jgi:BMFP domain-containing protein YqiC